MINFTHYLYRVTWSASDNLYIGLCAEFPSLSWLADNQIDALNGITDLVKEVVKEMEQCSEEIPKPFSERIYSGQIKIRIPADVHRALAVSAAEQNISLNRLINSKLNVASQI